MYAVLQKPKPNEKTLEPDDDLRPEYDLAELLKGGVREKHAERYREDTNLVLLAPDVANAFPDADSVNEALRLVIRLAELQQRPPAEQ